MSRGARIAIAVAVVLLVANLFAPTVDRADTATSWGRGPDGFGALRELLVERELGGQRSLEALDRLPRGGTMWWIEPAGVCDEAVALREAAITEPGEPPVWRARDWIEAGGQAVVFLRTPGLLGELFDWARDEEEAGEGRGEPGEGDADLGTEEGQGEPGEGDADPDAEEEERRTPFGRRCDAIAGIELPERSERAAPPPTSRSIVPVGWRIEGEMVPRPRRLPVGPLFAFDEALEWRVAARADGRPFALERALGLGRLVVVADAGFLRNRSLGAADSAPLAVDLARRYGAAVLDERAHGFVPEDNVARYLARSPAAPVFAGLIGLGLLTLWRGTAWPARQIAPKGAAPTLEAFVASLASLYARTGDHGRVLARYRALAAARIRRHYGLPPDLPDRALVERLARDGRAPRERLEALLAEPGTVDGAGLRAAVRELDALVEEATA